jgi:hypothetical protein
MESDVRITHVVANNQQDIRPIVFLTCHGNVYHRSETANHPKPRGNLTHTHDH